jgi:L-ascorbate metabolism protein UlaG (beta-lactamase superfamily)
MAGLFVGALVVACGGGGGGGTSAPTTTPTTTPANARVPAIPAAFDGINRAFDAQPPSATGPNSARDTAITQFDALLWATDATRTTPSDVIDYYQARMARVATELAQPVTSGFRVWAMYNHGFIVKTASTTIAFDLVEGKSSFNGPAWTVQLPQALLERIDVLMVSHEHGDHTDLTDRIPAAIKARGGAVLYPQAGPVRASTTLPMVGRQSAVVRGLKVTAHEVLHNAPTLVYEVTTPEGYRIVHTGDAQTSTSLPVLEGVELLLLNGWINESGSASNLTDMKSSLDKLRPDVMVPGHFEELSHVASDANVNRDGRYRFLDALPLQNSALGRSKTVVLTWGERLDYGKSPCPTGQVRIYADCRLAGSVPPDAVPAVVNLSSQFPDRSSNASALPPFGLAMAPETATLWASRWAADAGPGAVLRFNANTGSYNGAFASPGAYPSEMSFDGNDLWLVDYVAGAPGLFRMATDGRVLASLPLPLTSPAHRVGGLAGDAGHLYMAETVNNPNTGDRGSRIVELDRTTGRVLRVVYSSATAMISGLALREGSMWFVSRPFTNPTAGPPPATLTNLSLAGVVLSARQEATDSPLAQRLYLGLTAGRDFFLTLSDNRVQRYDIY